MQKRPISAFLLAAMLTVILTSCGDTGQTPDNGTTAPDSTDTTTAEALTGRDAVQDNLPEKNYNGTAFTILTRTKYDYEFGANEENGDIVNDAVYHRNRTVEERFNVDIVTVPVACGYGEEATAFNTMLTASIMAGDGAYDLVAGYAATIPKIVSEGIFYNWMEVEYIDTTQPWWSEDVAEELTINGKCYLLTGDLSLALWKGMKCMLFNKQMIEDYNVEDPYQLVRDGKWTLDTLAEITKNVSADLDGNDKMDEYDRYGYITDCGTALDNLQEALELPVTKKGEDGFPVLSLKSERTIEALTKANALINDSGNAYINWPVTPPMGCTFNDMFAEGRAMIYAAKLGDAEQLRNMDDDFGIIPFPKFNEEQKEYHSTSLDEFSAFVIPVDAKDVEMTGIITEALCAESYKQVIPVFYETALKTKAARDEESAEMIDLIRDGLIFNFGYLHSTSLGSVGHLFDQLIRDNSNDLVSRFDAGISNYESLLEKVLEIYR